MKNINQFRKYFVRSGLALTVAALGWLFAASAQEASPPMKPMKGGEHLMMLNNITNQAQADELKPNDEIAMVCSKCKSVSTEFITKESRGNVTKMTPGEKHLCPGCGGTVTVVGTGRGATTKITHTCSLCGSDSAFCCATSTNSPPTTGMGQK